MQKKNGLSVVLPAGHALVHFTLHVDAIQRARSSFIYWSFRSVNFDRNYGCPVS